MVRRPPPHTSRVDVVARRRLGAVPAAFVVVAFVAVVATAFVGSASAFGGFAPPPPAPLRSSLSPTSSSSSSSSSSSRSFSLSATSDDDGTTSPSSVVVPPPQVFATGYSPKLDLIDAVQDATEMALRSLPPVAGDESGHDIDLAFVTVSSLYDGRGVSPSAVVPAVLSVVEGSSQGRRTVKKLVGCTAGGIVGSVPNSDAAASDGGGASSSDGDADADGGVKFVRECDPVESEGVPGVSVTLCLLPDVEVKTFHVTGDDVPDDVGRVPPEQWKSAVGLRGFDNDERNDDENEEKKARDYDVGPPIFFLVPSPAFQNDLDDLLRGLSHAFPHSKTFGGIASTVSSLSRARLFRYDSDDRSCVQTLADGCVGVALKGDVTVRTMIAQGAKGVGGVYRVVTGGGSTVGAIVLDEAATEEELEAEEEEEEEAEDNGDEEDEDASAKDEAAKKKAEARAAYEKARIPKPVLAEANFVMKTLSDDERSFMRRALLLGIDKGGTLGRTPSELLRLAEGKGHRFAVHRVASAGMKDGSVTLPLGTVDVKPGTRVRFFVREGKFAKEEVKALWMGYKKKALEESFLRAGLGEDDDEGKEAKKAFVPTGAMLLATLDRGQKLFGGKPGYESNAISEVLPTIPSIGGFYANGVLGRLDDDDVTVEGGSGKLGDDEVMVHGSASCFALFGSKSNRPIYSPAKAAAAAEKQKAEDDTHRAATEEDSERTSRTESSPPRPPPDAKIDDRSATTAPAPRSDDGELLLKRREVHSGRAISVSTVEWSVAEKVAQPTSILEGFMWDKEAEVDRFRERVPLTNLLSQCKLSAMDPTSPKPRDWIGTVKDAAARAEDDFVIIPECKRTEPTIGSLRRRYDVKKLCKKWTAADAPALSVNADPILFGGSLDDVTAARESSTSAAAVAGATLDDDGVVVPPILASDLILYPYQIYKLRLAGADAANLLVGALERKDLLYLTKIASSLKMQTVASCTSEAQIRKATYLPEGSLSALVVSNRMLETFAFDETGEQALSLLRSDALREFREKHGEDVPVLAEGRVGIVASLDDGGKMSREQYLRELREAGAFGAIVGGGLALKKDGGDDEGNEEAGETVAALPAAESLRAFLTES